VSWIEGLDSTRGFASVLRESILIVGGGAGGEVVVAELPSMIGQRDDLMARLCEFLSCMRCLDVKLPTGTTATCEGVKTVGRTHRRGGLGRRLLGAHGVRVELSPLRRWCSAVIVGGGQPFRRPSRPQKFEAVVEAARVRKLRAEIMMFAGGHRCDGRGCLSRAAIV